MSILAERDIGREFNERSQRVAEQFMARETAAGRTYFWRRDESGFQTYRWNPRCPVPERLGQAAVFAEVADFMRASDWPGENGGVSGWNGEVVVRFGRLFGESH